MQSAGANCRCMCMSLCVCVCTYSYGCSCGCGWKIGCPTKKGERGPPPKKGNPQKTPDITAPPTTRTHRFRFGNPCKHRFLIQCEHGKSFHNEKCPKKENDLKKHILSNTPFSSMETSRKSQRLGNNTKTSWFSPRCCLGQPFWGG